MLFKFTDEDSYLEGWEYMMRINEGFICDPYDYTIEIKPIDHDQLPIYDEEVVQRLQKICKCEKSKESVDTLLAKEMAKK